MMARRRPGRRIGWVTSIVLALVVSALSVGNARADGDPASDYLVAQTSFVPADAGSTLAQRAHLQGVLNAAARAGYPIRVAVIASPSDLGSIDAAWRHPQQYAAFLGSELSAVHSRVLVVMPNGFGLSQPASSPAGDLAQLARTPAPARSRSLITLGGEGVANLAAASGHPIRSATIVAAPLAAPAAGGDGAITWSVLIVGAALLAAAWTLSVRERPLRVGAPRS